jgi:hypothetical protein
MLCPRPVIDAALKEEKWSVEPVAVESKGEPSGGN